VDNLLRPEVIAAVDLGSNSFHMIVGELRHGQLAIIDRIRETVRLAVLLKRSRSQEDIPRIGLSVDDHSLELCFDAAWLQANPLTVADLEREQEYLGEAGYQLTIR